METNKIPVTILTGFLGSGKTTLVKYLLTSKEHKKRLAVINNEFGSKIGIDNEVKEGMENAACVAELFETQNGCICCGGKGDFLRIMQTLIKNKDRFDYIIIETTGMADPSFTQDFFLDAELKEEVFLDGIVTVVDSANSLRHLNREPQKSPNEMLTIINESIEQIAVADRILMNKIDLVSNEALQKLETRIREINKYAKVSRCSYSKVEVDSILNIKSFNIEKVLERDPQFLEFRPFRQHDSSIESTCFIAKRPVEIEKFTKWMNNYLARNKENVFRSKGVVYVKDSPERYIFQGVHSSFEFEKFSKWNHDELALTKLIFIGKNLDFKEISETFTKEVGVPIKTEEELFKPPPSFFGIAVLILILGLLVYPGELSELMTFTNISVVFVILSSLYYYQSLHHPLNSL